jgi:ankyrin repeat protein
MDTFKHNRIDLEGPSFRLLRLVRGSGKIIECALVDAWLDEEILIPYSALSYTWGGNQKKEFVTMEDGSILNITSNLYFALLNLREQHSDRILWVDAICIDQDNPHEQGHQVRQMANIYKKAEEVIIWLGLSDPTTELIMDSMQRLKELTNDAYRNWKIDDDRWTVTWEQELSGSADKHPDLYEQRRSALKALLENPWFRRVWIIQEAANARRAKILCGTKSVPASMLSIMTSLISSSSSRLVADSRTQAVLDVLPGPSRSSSWWSQNRDLHTLMEKFGNCEASNPRDKIFALLGISSDACNDIKLAPDYTMSIQEILYRTTCFLLSVDCENFAISDFPDWTIFNFTNILYTKRFDDALFEWAVQHKHDHLFMTLAKRDCFDKNILTFLGKSLIVPATDYVSEYTPSLLTSLDQVDTNLWNFDDEPVSIKALRRSRAALVKTLMERNNIVPSPDIAAFLPAGPGNEHGTTYEQLLISNVTNADLSGKSGSTMLRWAAQNAHEAILKLLLESSEVDPNIKDDDGQTPLVWAAQNGHEAVVKLLLESSKVDVNERGNNGQTLLGWAARNGREAVVKLLLESSKVDVNIKDDDGQTPLGWAAQYGHKAVVKLLLESSKVDVNISRNDGQTPLGCAARNGHEAIVKLLLESSKVDVNITGNDGQTPLGWAAQYGHEAVVKLLLESSKVDVNISRNDGQTPLGWAACYGCEAVVKLLLNSGKVDVNIRGNDGQTPLGWAARYGREAVVKLLLDSGKVNVNIRDNNGRTLLGWAAQYGYRAVVKLLLESGKVDVNIRDNDGQTSLGWAAQRGHEAVVKLLLESDKVDADMKDYAGRTPLRWAALNGYEAVVKLLLESGKVDADIKDKDGQTLLGWAASNGYEALVKLLSNSGKVDADIKDNAGRTPLG